ANRFSVRTLPSSIDRVQQITARLDQQFHFKKDGAGKTDVQVQTVGPTIASDLVRTAILLVLVSSVLIAAYLAFAFRKQRSISPWRFSVCTFFKLLHDVFVLAGIWAILGHFSTLGEVDSLFVTAILTSVAFSIHDTIVVFDRVRENLRQGPRLTFNQVINLSTVQTMTRSLNTALTVVFVLLAMVLFGGGTIRGFVLALLIGIVTGTFSSIFNASTLLVAWQSVDRRDTEAPTPGGARRIQRAA
ncbi:MAG: protein translocase subunit SecF, partial [Candidatus Dormibacteria bacterium]